MKHAIKFLALLIASALCAFGQAVVIREASTTEITNRTGAGYVSARRLPSGGGTGTVTHTGALTANAVMVGNGTADSKVTGVTIDGSDNLSTAGVITAGSGSSVAGTVGIKQGTAPSVVANTVQRIAPTSVTGYNIVEAASAGSTGYRKAVVSGTTVTESVVTTIPAADIAAGTLANDFSTNTQTPGNNSTKLATTAYADTSSLASPAGDINLGAFAGGNTGGAPITLTLTKPNTVIFINAAAALRTYTLPAAAAGNKGWSVIYAVTNGTNHVNVKPNSGGVLYLNGTALTADHYIQAATSATGNFICMMSDGANWGNFGSNGTWADAASP